jgi:hypothetical protein
MGIWMNPRKYNRLVILLSNMETEEMVESSTFSVILNRFWNNRNLIIIGAIWIVIALHSYYDYISSLEHYNWAVDYDHARNSPNSDEMAVRDDIMEPGKLAIAFRGSMWGLFFTGYFLNAHSKSNNSQ